MNENINIIDVNESEFNDQVIEASANKLIVVDFWAPWCGPCKQLTPILEKIISKSGDKITLVKINIDENQQIAAQLRIQSIPTVYARTSEKVVNAFHAGDGNLHPIIVFDGGNKDQFKRTEELGAEILKLCVKLGGVQETKDTLLEFISKNSDEIKGICFYLECLIELKQFEEVEMFISSLEKDVQNKDEVKQVLKKMEIVKNNSSGPNINELLGKLEKEPSNLDLIIELSEKYFSMKEYENGMDFCV
jgi:putative thioredoxin